MPEPFGGQIRVVEPRTNQALVDALDVALAAQVDALALELQYDARRGVGHGLAEHRVEAVASGREALPRLLAEDWDGIAELAKEQQAEGAHVLDVCVAYVGRDEVRDMSEALKKIVPAVSLPIMIDTTQLDVLEAALKLIGGRPIINSINLYHFHSQPHYLCLHCKTSQRHLRSPLCR